MPDDRERWERAQRLFHAALDVPAAERERYVRAACAGDTAIMAEVLAMLKEDGRTGPLERELGTVAAGVLDGSVPLLDRIGPYRILGVAGRGGMGVVYAAEREDLGSRAAIKVLRDATLSPARRERFASEQRVLARLDHPAVARMLDADVLPDGTPYFIMEYVEGLTLTEHARARGLTIRQRLELFRQICAGVQYAHAAAVVHRDLKPSNILVREDGAVKLLDFGIAKQLEGLDPPADRTTTGLRLMTPSHAAPEQLTGDAVGTYTDVYSLGVVLYELLTGRLPFDADLTPGQLEAAILDGKVERPSRASRGAAGGPPDVDRTGAATWEDLDVLCQTAMHRDAARRYRTVEALARDVERLLAREPLEARGDGLGYRLDRFVRRRARPLLAAAAAIAVLAAVSAQYTRSLALARDRALVEQARAEQTQEFLLDLFRGGDATLGPTDSLRVVDLLGRGVEHARLLAEQPRLQAEVYRTLGSIYHQLGDLAHADSLLELALDRHRTLFGEDGPDVAPVLVALGLLRSDQARVDEGERLIRAGLDLSRAASPPRPRDVAAASVALGQVLQDRGAHAEAITALEDAVRLHGQEPTAALAQALVALAGAHFYAGDYAVSDSLNRAVLALNERLHGPRHPHVADALINLGAIRFEEGRYDRAESLYRQALAIKLESFGDAHHQIAANRTMLGRALVAQGRHVEALAELEPALRIREGAFGPSHPAVASTLNEIGTVLLTTGDLAGAEARYTRMLAIYDQVYGPEHAFGGVALSNLASVHAEAGEFVRAEAAIARAVARFTAALGPDHPNTAVALIKLGGLLRRQERWSEAVDPLLAGYHALAAQAHPGAPFLQAARLDLSRAYEALGDPDAAGEWAEAHERHAGPEA